MYEKKSYPKEYKLTPRWWYTEESNKKTNNATNIRQY